MSVHVLKTGIEIKRTEPDVVLEGAKGLLNEVVVIGVEPNGQLYVATSESLKSDIVYLLEKVKHGLLAGNYD